MINIYKRAYEIIKYVYERPNKLDIKSLSKLLGVGCKTIQTDIQKIKKFFELKEIALLEEKNNKFSFKKIDKSIYRTLNSLSFYDYKLSKNERLVIETLLLLFVPNYITLAHMAKFMYVSRSTVISDLKDLNLFLKEYGLSKTSHPNIGIKIDGAEENIRNLFVNILEKYDYLYSLFFHQEGIKSMEFSEAKVEDSGKNIILQNITSEVEGYINLNLTEYSFNMLVNYLYFVLYRINLGKKIKNYKPHINEGENYFIEKLYELVCQHFNLIYNQNEFLYLRDFSSNLIYLKKNDSIESSREIVKIQTITRLFIMNVSESLNFPLYRDYELFKSLSNHLQRIFNEGIINTFKIDEINVILEKYGDIREIVSENVDILESHMNRKITEEEVSYIVIYICAAVEKMKTQKMVCNVILICNSGIGTSQLLKSKLLERFDFNIVNIIPKHKLKDQIDGQVDFIISTVYLENEDIPYIKISPQLTDSDFLRMKKMISDHGKIKSDKYEKKEYSVVIDKIRAVVNNEELFNDIQLTVREFFVKKKSLPLSLSNLLTEDFIQVDVEAENWKEAIEKASKNLLEKGFIKEDYIKSMIENVEKNGPYIVISEGFAIPHSEIDEESNKIVFNLIKLKEPVVFNAGILDPIRYVCVVNAIDKEQHLNALFNLVNLLQINEFNDALNKANSSYQLAEVIRLFEKRLH